jgi:hypothetical protein
MNISELSTSTDDAIQNVGMQYYFAPSSAAKAETLGINQFEFYGLGRGGVLGGADTKEVVEAFTFFSSGAIEFLYGAPRSKADPVAIAKAHIDAAYDYADLTFGGVPTDALSAFAKAAGKVVQNVKPGQYALFDGYMQFPFPQSPVHAAYLATILLRELRGGAHIDAIKEVGISAVDATYLENPGIYKMHGFTDEEAPEVNAELEALKKKADAVSDAKFAEYLSVLDDAEQKAFLDGVNAMFAATTNPKAV